MTTNRRRLLILGLALFPAHAYAAEPFKIAFVDTGNTGRSLMAVTLARAMIAKRGMSLAVISRGLDIDPFDEAPEANAAILMTQRGSRWRVIGRGGWTRQTSSTPI